jgi:HlyD family secretion protein
LYGLGGVGLIGLAVWLFRPAPILVDVATISRGPLEVVIQEEGKTRVQDRFVISSPIAGRLQRLAVQEGDSIETQQLIAQIDPLPTLTQAQALQAQILEMEAEKRGVDTQRPKTLALVEAEARIYGAIAAENEAQARVEEAKAALEQMSRDRQRAEALYQEGAIAQQALENAQLAEITQQQSLSVAQREVERIQAEVLEAQAELKRLEAEQQDPDYLLGVYDARIRSLEAELVNLADEAQRTEIRSPTAGLVLRLYEESHRFVEAGTPLLEVGNPGELEFVVDVLSEDAVQVEPGDWVRIEEWGGDRPVIGKVRTVEPAAFTEVSALGVEEQRVNVVVDFEAIPDNLGDGYRAEAQIIIGYEEFALKVPIGALFRCDQSWCVFVVEADKATERMLELGQRNQLEAAVITGLRVGDMVILHPSEIIQGGTSVRIR